MPIYEYECPTHGVCEIVHSIKDDTIWLCGETNKLGRMRIACHLPMKRLISSGIGIAMDTDKLWDKAPTPENPRGEKRSDLKKHEAFLIGVPPKDRDRFRDYHRGKGNPREM